MVGVSPESKFCQDRATNLLEIVLESRAKGLVSPLKVEEVELIVEYGPYPSALQHPSPY